MEESSPDNTEKIGHQESLFLAETSKDALRVLSDEIQTNEYIAHLKTVLDSAGTEEGRLAIADYGINQVGEEENLKLASYFFVISCLKDFPSIARDFFTDAMVYCEDQMGPLKNAASIREKYKKEIRPAL